MLDPVKNRKQKLKRKIKKFKDQLEDIKNTNIDYELSLIKESQDLAKQIEQKQMIEQVHRDKVKTLKRKVF